VAHLDKIANSAVGEPRDATKRPSDVSVNFADHGSDAGRCVHIAHDNYFRPRNAGHVIPEIQTLVIAETGNRRSGGAKTARNGVTGYRRQMGKHATDAAVYKAFVAHADV